jgi:hypothetical protein
MATFQGKTVGGSLASAIGLAAAIDPEPISKGILLAATGFIALTNAILQAFGVGPDPNNVPASQLEQAFEAASDNVQMLYKAGMISDAQRQQINQALLAQGTAYYQQIIGKGGDVKPFQDGLANMTATIRAEAAARPAVTGSQELTLNAARSLYLSGSGWYPGSLQKAAELTDGIVNDLLSNPIVQMGGVAAGIGNDILGLFGGTAASNGTANAQSPNAKYVGWGVIGVVALKILHFF